MKTIKKVLVTYKFFTYVFLVMTGLLLLRVPLGTFNVDSRLDTIGHFVLPATGAPLLLLMLQEAKFLPGVKTAPFIFMTFLLGVTIEALWEIFEFSVDVFFNQNWQPGAADTMLDIISAVCGSLVGGLLFTKIYRSKLSDR
jgi:hypothetical protein